MTIRSFEPKDPEETDFWNIDFSDRMPTADTIASIVTVFIDAAASPDEALLIDEFAYSGKVVSGRWRAGTSGETYRITARVTTALGRTLDKSGEVFITDT
jgi:hypothetical protein